MTRRSSRHFAPERRACRPLPVVLPVLAAVIAVGSWLHNSEILGSPTRPMDGPLVPMQGETVIHHPAPEREGEIAARESLEPEGSLKTMDRSSSSPKLGTSAQNGLTGRRDAHLFPATPHVLGLDGKGSFYVRSWDLACQPTCNPPLIREFTLAFTTERR